MDNQTLDDPAVRKQMTGSELRALLQQPVLLKQGSAGSKGRWALVAISTPRWSAWNTPWKQATSRLSPPGAGTRRPVRAARQEAEPGLCLSRNSACQGSGSQKVGLTIPNRRPARRCWVLGGPAPGNSGTVCHQSDGRKTGPYSS